ncbi:MAG: hypothetical protein ABSE59_08430, partial [Opitutaceae bacterium]
MLKNGWAGRATAWSTAGLNHGNRATRQAHCRQFLNASNVSGFASTLLGLLDPILEKREHILEFA